MAIQIQFTASFEKGAYLPPTHHKTAPTNYAAPPQVDHSQVVWEPVDEHQRQKELGGFPEGHLFIDTRTSYTCNIVYR